MDWLARTAEACPILGQRRVNLHHFDTKPADPVRLPVSGGHRLYLDDGVPLTEGETDGTALSGTKR